MNETVATLILAAIAALCLYAGYWAITRRGTGGTGGNPGGDPHALSANSADVLKTR